MTSKEKYLKRIAGQESEAIKEAKTRVENRSWLIESQKLALKILIRLDELGWKQATLANELGVTAQYVNKLVKGNEKFGFDILVKLQDILDIPILDGYKIKGSGKENKSNYEFKRQIDTAQTAVDALKKFNVEVSVRNRVYNALNLPDQKVETWSKKYLP